MAGFVQAPLTSLDVELEPIQLVAPDGTPTTETRYRRDLPPETLGWLYESMAVTRALDAEFVNLQRQGELALFASCRGQEAAQIGAAACLRKTDWLFPQYREIGAFLLRGITPAQMGAVWRGRWHGGLGFTEKCVAPIAIPIGTHGLHAVGAAMAAQRLGERFGDGRLPRRRRDQRGRRARSAQFRRRLQGAVRVLRAEQPVGDLRPGQPSAGGPVDRAPGYRLRNARHSGRRQRRAGVLRGDGRGRRTRPQGARARRSSRRSPTGWDRTPPPTTRPATGRRTRSTSGRRWTRFRATATTYRTPACGANGWSTASRRGRRGCALNCATRSSTRPTWTSASCSTRSTPRSPRHCKPSATS